MFLIENKTKKILSFKCFFLSLWPIYFFAERNVALVENVWWFTHSINIFAIANSMKLIHND